MDGAAIISAAQA